MYNVYIYICIYICIYVYIYIYYTYEYVKIHTHHILCIYIVYTCAEVCITAVVMSIVLPLQNNVAEVDAEVTSEARKAS